MFLAMAYFHEDWKEIKQLDEKGTSFMQREPTKLRLWDFVPVHGLREYSRRNEDLAIRPIEEQRRFTRNILILGALNFPYVLLNGQEERI